MEYKDTQNKTISLFGICQGFELLHVLVANSTDALDKFKSRGVTSKMIFNPVFRNSSVMYKDFSDEDKSTLESTEVLAQFHNLGTGFKQYEAFPALKDFFKVTGLGKDTDGKIYFNSVEANDYPIFAVQFHPEKVSYTDVDMAGVPDSIEAVRVSQQFGNFFGAQSRLSTVRAKQSNLKKYDYVDTFRKTPLSNNGTWVYYFNKTMTDNHHQSKETIFQ